MALAMIIDSVSLHICTFSNSKRNNQIIRKNPIYKFCKKIIEVTWNSYFYKLKSDLEKKVMPLYHNFRIFFSFKFAKKDILKVQMHHVSKQKQIRYQRLSQ